jgi:hypothetical protein
MTKELDHYGLLPTDLFVRSQGHLSLDNEKATGLRITAIEVLNLFGPKIIQEVFDYSCAILPISADEPAATIRSRRESLGLSLGEVALSSGLTVEEVLSCEDKSKNNPFRNLEKVSEVLGLDPKKLSFYSGADALKI